MVDAPARESGALGVRGVEADGFLRVEQHALDPIPLSDRHGAPRGLLLLWAASQANFTSLLTGAILLAFFGLGVWDAITAAIAGTVVAAIVLGLLSVIGPRTGATQVVASRMTFGWVGAYGGAFLTLVLAIGWFAVVCVLATNAFLELAEKAGLGNSDGLAAVVLLLVIGVAALVGVYGHQTISVFERYGAVAFLAFCVLLAPFVLPDVQWSYAATAHGGARAGGWVLGAVTFFALVASWFGFVSDYSRYLPATSSSRAVAGWAAGGIILSTVTLGTFGILIFTIDPNADTAIFSAIDKAVPGWLSTAFFLWTGLSLLWGAYFDVYTAGLATLAMNVPLSRWGGAALVGVVGGAIAFWAKFSSGFLTSYENFLLFSYIWAPAWAAVVLADFFIVHRADAPVGVMERVRHAVNWRAIIAWVAGTAVAIPFVNTTFWKGPVPEHLFAGADFSGPVGFIVGGALYLVLARRGAEAALTPQPPLPQGERGSM